MSKPSDDAILVVSRRIKPGREKEYADWLRRVIESANKFPGYMGVTTLTPQGFESSLRYLIWRFDSPKTLEVWEKSDVRNKFVEEVQNYAVQHYETGSGMETWFTLPDMRSVVAPPKWKMFLVTVFAAYLVSFVTRLLLGSFVKSWPLFESTFVFTLILGGSLTYLAMPTLSKLLRKWLYPKQLKM